MSEKTLLPFAAGTRLRRQYVGSVPFAAGAKAPSLQMPRVGMLSRLVVILDAAPTFSAGGAFADSGPWNVISRIQLNTNIGSAAVIDVSGYGGYVVGPHYRQGNAMGKAGIGSVTPAATQYVAPVAAAARVLLPWVFNVAVNQGQNFTDGLLNLQAPEVSVSVDITFGALTDYSTTLTALVGNAYVYYEYFEIPDPRAFEMPRLALHRTLEESTPVGQTGANILTLPRMGTLLSLDNIIRLNGVRSDSWDSFALRFNKTDSVYQVDQRWQRTDERYWLGIDSDVGTIRQDFFHSQELLNAGTSRDAIDTEQLTTLEQIVNVSAGAGLGVGNNSITTVRRIVQILD
jgi:hypothetical protein